MVPSPETLAVETTYPGFFGLARAPFASSTDPGQQFQCEQYSLLMEHLEFAAANADSLVVVCGADGSGKSGLIDRFMSGIQDRFSCVRIDAAAHQGVVPFYKTFLQQLGFNEITGTANELANITKEFLVCRGIARDHILVIIDNTHLVDPRILEQLRRLCDIRIKDCRAISVALFGNADIVRVVDAPAMRHTVFASHVIFNIRSYSEADTTGYIRHRLELAGATDESVFPESVCSLIHRYSGGNPGRISKLGADVLAEAHRLKSRTVSTDIVRAVINRQRLLPHLTPLIGKGRRRSDPKVELKVVPDAIDSHASQARIAELVAQVGRLEESRSQALLEVEGRNKEVQSLRDALDAQKKEAEKLLQSVASHATVITRQDQALSERARLLTESESDVRRLTSELSRELRAKDAAHERLDKATAAILELTRSKADLQVTVSAIEAELRTGRSAAAQRAVETEALERTAVHLRAEMALKMGELESLRSELASRNAAVADLELRLESQTRAGDAAAITARNRALSDSTAALQVSEQRANHLATELGREVRAREELQGTIDALVRASDDLRKQVAERTAELESMRGELVLRNSALTELELRFEASRSESEAAESHMATLKDPAEFQALERLVQRLRLDLDMERGARRAADQGRDDATAAAQQLREEEGVLRATVRKLDIELKAARERAFSAYALENYVADLQRALEERTSELNARSQTIADLERQLGKLKSKRESNRNRMSAAKIPDDATTGSAAVRPAAEGRAWSSHVIEQHERSLMQIPAYQMLREHDPGFYDGWLKEYQVLAGQGLSDKQLSDALRANQARWMERHLPRASDQSVLAYARLLVEQLDEFLRDGMEPCLSLLIPQPKPGKGVAPDFSRGPVERELDLLQMVLTTHDARRALPKEDDVWPDLEPIFVELFDSFGADNVAAIENSFNPKLDRSLLGNVSRTLFLRVLALPETKAAAALRWMLASK